VKYAYIASQRTDYAIGMTCRVLEVSTSGFFAWQARERAPQSDTDAPLRESIILVQASTPSECIE